MPTLTPKVLFRFISLIFIASLVSVGAHAQDGSTQVYRSVQPDGSVLFTDQAKDGAETVRIKALPTVAPFENPVSGRTTPNTQSESSQSISSPYKSFSIVSPQNDTAFHSGNGQVTVTLLIDPPLRPRHQVAIFLDGKKVAEGPSSQFTIGNVDRGTHQLSAQIANSNGAVLDQKKSSFTVHRPTIKRTAN